MLGVREYTIIALACLCAFLAFMLDSEVRAHSKFKGEVERAQKASEDRAKEINAHQEEVVKDVSNSWYAALPGVRSAAVAEYVRRFGGAARLCPPAGGVLPAVHPGNDVPAAAESAEVHDGGEPEQLACTSEFIGICAEDARARKLTREWALRLNLKAE